MEKAHTYKEYSSDIASSEPDVTQNVHSTERRRNVRSPVASLSLEEPRMFERRQDGSGYCVKKERPSHCKLD
jgi:hypothetical protein